MTAIISRPAAPTSSSCGRSTARTARWEKSRNCFRRIPRGSASSRVIPKQDVVAAGFADGMVLLVRIDDAAEILVKKPGPAPVTAMAFSPDGKSFAFGCEDGEAGIVDLG